MSVDIQEKLNNFIEKTKKEKNLSVLNIQIDDETQKPICSISYEEFENDAYLGSDGYVYKKSTVDQLLQQNASSPFTRQPIQFSVFTELNEFMATEFIARNENRTNPQPLPSTVNAPANVQVAGVLNNNETLENRFGSFFSSLLNLFSLFSSSKPSKLYQVFYNPDKLQQKKQVISLINSGEDVNYVRGGGVSILIQAMTVGKASEDTLNILIDKMSDKTLKVTRHGRTALDIAQEKGYSQALQKKIALRMTQGSHHQNQLYQVFYNPDKAQQKQQVISLINNGEDVNYVRGGGVSILIQAMTVGKASEDTLNILIDKMSDKTLKVTRHGRTALDIAQEKGYSQALQKKIALRIGEKTLNNTAVSTSIKMR